MAVKPETNYYFYLAPDAPFFMIILLCLTSDDFTCQWESAATQWVS
jgi:hypothetical protein